MTKISLRRSLASFLFGVTGLVALVATGAPATAADSTSFNPLSVSVQAQPISGVPVGTVISWPVSNNPDGWSSGNWLECNGQGISSSAYPELYAAVGGSVPDLRGLFLRGVGGNAAGLGSTQGDAGRNVTGSTGIENHGNGNIWTLPHEGYTYGAIYTIAGGIRATIIQNGNATTMVAKEFGIDASRVWGSSHTANEFRPVNKAVRYLIRARP